MSSTNKTANYELSQFVGTDIPSILSDYNGDMRKIDAGIAEVATSAGSSASAVSALAGRVTTAENSITSLNGALEVTNQRSIQNQTAITAVQGVIPSDASTENLLATSDDVSDVADNVRGVDERVQAIEAVVPSTASSSNKLATMADISSGTIGYRLIDTQTVTEANCNDVLFTMMENAGITKDNAFNFFFLHKGTGGNVDTGIRLDFAGNFKYNDDDNYQSVVYKGNEIGAGSGSMTVTHEDISKWWGASDYAIASHGYHAIYSNGESAHGSQAFLTGTIYLYKLG